MNQIEQKTISSREVAEMMEVTKHSHMLDKIDKINQILLNRNIGSVDYWYESEYKDCTGRTLREYQVTKKGCELIAHKTEGEKGILFTVKYMERFELMEQIIRKPKSVIDLIELELKAIKAVDSKVDEVKQDLEEFKQSVPLYACDMDKITTAVKKKGVKCLGGKESNSYSDKSLRGKVYSDIYDQLKRQFGVSSYKSIRREQCDLALGIINGYQLPIILKEEVADCNMQMHL